MVLDLFHYRMFTILISFILKHTFYSYIFFGFGDYCLLFFYFFDSLLRLFVPFYQIQNSKGSCSNNTFCNISYSFFLILKTKENKIKEFKYFRLPNFLFYCSLSLSVKSFYPPLCFCSQAFWKKNH